MRVVVPSRVTPGVDRGRTLVDKGVVEGNAGGQTREEEEVVVMMMGKLLNISLVVTRSITNWAVQPQKMDRGLKFWI